MDNRDGFPRDLHSQYVYVFDDNDCGFESLIQFIYDTSVGMVLVVEVRNAIRDSFKLIDFTSSQSNILKALILRSLALPQFINHTHGKRLLSM